MEDIDPEFFKSLLFMIQHEGIVENLDLTFTYEEDQFGQIKIEDLLKDGKNIPVTEKNK
jgi:E3 ubiquitin-protein ligase HUWE1